MTVPALKLAEFHSLHRSCGSIVDIKPDRTPIDGSEHPFYAWCPACGATSREIVELDRVDRWLEAEGGGADAEETEFTHAMFKARAWLSARA